MKKVFLSFAVAMVGMMPADAQQYLLINEKEIIPVDEIEKITYEADADFDSRLLPGRLATDTKTTLFTEALKLTHLADTLKAYWYPEYDGTQLEKFYYVSDVRKEVAWFNKQRSKQFTVFAETDDVFAAQGITNLEQLKAYAKKIYDETFPEDAGVTDPTDRRNSLNRFVAYHVLCHGSTYWYLTYYDGVMTDNFVDTSLTDINVWYSTLMPQGALKCSYPKIPDSPASEGVYLNHRGLQGGPDKYGYQIRGAKVVQDEAAGGFDHPCSNGYYFHIDRILAYDKQTRDDVLASELWRVDFKTLSPDFMNNAEELRGNYLVDDNSSIASESIENGCNYIYRWDAMENITANAETTTAVGLVHRRAHSNFWSWQGDEVNIFGDYDITIKLPPLPAGEWEVRLGECALPTRTALKVYLNNQLMHDSLVTSSVWINPESPFDNGNAREKITEILEENYISINKQENGRYLLTDLKTGEQLLSTSNPYNSYIFQGTDPVTGEKINWTERVNNYIAEYLNSLPVMNGSRECLFFIYNNGYISSYRFSNTAGGRTIRLVLGRLQTDGKSDNYLRLKSLKSIPYGNDTESMLDYLEFVPKFVYDNKEIPEE